MHFVDPTAREYTLSFRNPHSADHPINYRSTRPETRSQVHKLPGIHALHDLTRFLSDHAIVETTFPGLPQRGQYMRDCQTVKASSEGRWLLGFAGRRWGIGGLREL
jgi:hypothetical protein